MPRLTVFGRGYLGTVHAARMAQAGFRVLGLDTDRARVGELRAGQPRIHEPGLDDSATSPTGGALEPARWTAAGWRYRALGRPDPVPSPTQRSMRASSSSVSTGLVT